MLIFDLLSKAFFSILFFLFLILCFHNCTGSNKIAVLEPEQARPVLKTSIHYIEDYTFHNGVYYDSILYEYNKQGKQLSMNMLNKPETAPHFAGHKAFFTYDSTGKKPISCLIYDYNEGRGGKPGKWDTAKVSYHYDPLQRLVSVSQDHSYDVSWYNTTTNYEYDKLNRKVLEEEFNDGILKVKESWQFFDSDLLVVHKRESFKNSGMINSELSDSTFLNPDSLVVKKVIVNPNNRNYKYQRWANCSNCTWSHEYNNKMRISSEARLHAFPDSILYEAVYKYDSKSRLIQCIESWNGKKRTHRYELNYDKQGYQIGSAHYRNEKPRVIIKKVNSYW